MASFNRKIVDEIVARYKPPRSWEVTLKRKGYIFRRCHCSHAAMSFRAPEPHLSRDHLFVYLHEYAHYLEDHRDDRDTGRGEAPQHVQEFEAERWAMHAMRKHGLSVSRRGIAEAKKYVRWCIAKDRKRGIAIAPHIRRWSGWKPGVTAR